MHGVMEGAPGRWGHREGSPGDSNPTIDSPEERRISEPAAVAFRAAGLPISCCLFLVSMSSESLPASPLLVISRKDSRARAESTHCPPATIPNVDRVCRPSSHAGPLHHRCLLWPPPPSRRDWCFGPVGLLLIPIPSSGVLDFGTPDHFGRPRSAGLLQKGRRPSAAVCRSRTCSCCVTQPASI